MKWPTVERPSCFAPRIAAQQKLSGPAQQQQQQQQPQQQHRSHPQQLQRPRQAYPGAQPTGWAELPDSLLLPILAAASTSSTPATCLAACVCQQWRDAAQRLAHQVEVQLYVDSSRRARSFSRWLHHTATTLQVLDLEPFTLLQSAESRLMGTVHKALADAAVAASAAGQPLPLQQLLLYDHLTPLAHLRQLLAHLPSLQHLSMSTHPCPASPQEVAGASAARAAEALSALVFCSSLVNLQLTTAHQTFDRVQSHFPASLQELQVVVVGQRCFAPFAQLRLSHLSCLTRLQLSTAGKFTDPRPFQALPALTALELTCNGLGPGMAQLQQVLVNLNVPYVAFDFLSSLTSLTSLSVGWGAADMVAANLLPALPCLTNLESASFRLGAAPLTTPPRLTGQLLAACQELTSLQDIDLMVPPHLDCSAVSLLTQVTALSLHICSSRGRKHTLSRFLPAALRQLAARRGGGEVPRAAAGGSASIPAWCAAISQLRQLQCLALQGRVLKEPGAGGWLTGLTSLTSLTVRPWKPRAALRCSHELAGSAEGLEELVRQLSEAPRQLQLVLLETWGRCLPMDSSRVLARLQGVLPPRCCVLFYRCPERLRAPSV